jgi:hypothetical protein
MNNSRFVATRETCIQIIRKLAEIDAPEGRRSHH